MWRRQRAAVGALAPHEPPSSNPHRASRRRSAGAVPCPQASWQGLGLQRRGCERGCGQRTSLRSLWPAPAAPFVWGCGKAKHHNKLGKQGPLPKCADVVPPPSPPPTTNQPRRRRVQLRTFVLQGPQWVIESREVRGTYPDQNRNKARSPWNESENRGGALPAATTRRPGAALQKGRCLSH